MPMTSSRRVGRHKAPRRGASMRKPTPNSPMMTHSSLNNSQMRGLVSGLIAGGIPGRLNAAQPSPISSAEAAGSRPETKRGSQCDRMMAPPSPTSSR